MPHFVLRTLSSGLIVEGPDVDESWCEGLPLEYELATPLRFVVDGAGLEPGSFYEGIVPVWSDKLLTAIKGAGVDNIEAYPAIVDFRSGHPAPEYWAVNVIGL